MTLRTLKSNNGFTYIGALVLVVILGIMMGRAAVVWKTKMQREKERELIFRGTQIMYAMRRFYGMPVDLDAVAPTAGGTAAAASNPNATPTPGTVPGGATLPTTLPATPILRELKDLLKDPNSAQTKRYLRKLYLDPMTGKDFEIVHDGSQRIIGVKSTSDAEPIKKSFQDHLELEPGDFENKKKYSEWQFVCIHYPQPGGGGGVSGVKTTGAGGSQGQSQGQGQTGGSQPPAGQ